MPELRKDPIVGRWVIIAHERAKRPNDFKGEAQAQRDRGSARSAKVRRTRRLQRSLPTENETRSPTAPAGE